MSTVTRASALLVVAFLAGGCGNDYEDICQEMIDCYGGNDTDVAVCVVDAETEADEAAVYDCEDEYDALIECIEQEFVCSEDDDDWDDKCESEDDDLDDCIDRESSLDSD